MSERCHDLEIAVVLILIAVLIAFACKVADMPVRQLEDEPDRIYKED